jgi:hypothetical protein
MVSVEIEETLLLREEPALAVSEWSSASRASFRIRRTELLDGLSSVAALSVLVENLEAMVEFWNPQFTGNTKGECALRHSRFGGYQSVPDSREPIGFITVGYYL